MRNIIKVNNILEAKDNPIRPLLAMDDNGVLFGEGAKFIPEGFVDLGLTSGILWAKYNIGATGGSTKESYYGDYYAWGGTQIQESYGGWNCPYCTIWDDIEGEYQFDKYVPTDQPECWGGEGDPDNKSVLDLIDDIANVTFGSNYRMPTKAEYEELIALPSQWVTNYNGISGLNGRVFTGTNGNTLFIPAAGWFDDEGYFGAGSVCNLWSSCLELDNANSAWCCDFSSNNIRVDSSNRYPGFSIRAVC